MKLILASASPRRAHVLRDAGIHFEAMATHLDESHDATESPEQLVRRLAEAKARDAAARASGPAIVLGADTEVVVDGAVLGKPESLDHAREMLRRLSGRTHAVLTALGQFQMRFPSTQLVELSDHSPTPHPPVKGVLDTTITSFVTTSRAQDSRWPSLCPCRILCEPAWD